MNDISQLRIAFIAGTLGQGGAEKQLYLLLRTLKEGGADLHLLCLARGEFWEEPIRELGIPVTWIGQSGSRTDRLRQTIGAIAAIRPLLIQSQHFYTNLYAALAGRWLGIPSIGAIRNDLHSEIRDSGRLFGPLCLRLPSRLVANSEAALSAAVELGVARAKLRLLTNAIETGRLPVEPVRVERPVRITAAGRLVRQKRMDRFLRLVSSVTTPAPNVNLLGNPECEARLYGEGPLRAELETEASRLGLCPPRLRFMGLTTNPGEIHEESDIFVLPSDWEGTPNVLLEAMAAGLPVVTTRVGDVATLISHGRNGYCFAPTDEDGMARAIRNLISDPRLRAEMGANARASISARFSSPRYRERVQNLYRTLHA